MTSDNNKNEEYFSCVCSADEHTLRFTFWEDMDNTDPIDNDAEIYTSVYLNNYHSFFKRMWIAIKYVFGKGHPYGHFDSFILRRDDTKRLRSMLDKFEAACQLADERSKRQ